MVYFDKLFQMYNIANTFQEQNIRSRFDDMGALQEDMSQLLLLEKFEYTGGPIFKVVLEC